MSGDLAGRHLLLVGPGYVAREVARQAIARGARVSATLRDLSRSRDLDALGVRPCAIGADGLLPSDALDGITDLLVSAPPGSGGCPAHAMLQPALGSTGLRWIGYYSSTAVYGDCGGAWIDETRAPAPRSPDAKGRLQAEAHWAEAARRIDAALDILRIAGIYGPEGRNVTQRLASGVARAIVKPGQYFNRIHREDIAAATLAALATPDGARLTNLADGSPCPASDILIGVADMMGLPRPAEVAFDQAELPPAAAGFYAENRRLRNDSMLALPGFRLRYPDWRDGYRAILENGG